MLMMLIALPVSGMRPRHVQHLEGEARVGICFPLGKFNGGTGNSSSSLGIEGRYNFCGTGWDAGLAFNLSCAERSFSDDKKDLSAIQTNRTMSALIMSHYNFNQGGRFNPFVGVGVGAGYCDIVDSVLFPAHGWYPAFQPCVGIEISTHARVSLQFNLSRKDFNNISLSFGAVLGGVVKKHRQVEGDK